METTQVLKITFIVHNNKAHHTHKILERYQQLACHMRKIGFSIRELFEFYSYPGFNPIFRGVIENQLSLWIL